MEYSYRIKCIYKYMFRTDVRYKLIGIVKIIKNPKFYINKIFIASI